MFDQSPFLKSNELQKDQDPLLKIVTHTRKQHPHVPNQNSFIHSPLIHTRLAKRAKCKCAKYKTVR